MKSSFIAGILFLLCASCGRPESIVSTAQQEPISNLDNLLLEISLDDMPNSASLDFLNGFAHGLDPKAYNDILKCVHDIGPDSWNRVMTDVHNLSKIHVKQTVQAIEDMAKVFISVVKDCKSAVSDVTRDIGILSRDVNAGVFAEHAMKFLIEPWKLVQVVDHIVVGFSKKNYFEAGDGTGEFVGVILGLRLHDIESFLKKISD
eukprot:CAMPEP_0168334650 /NCGR_PEP_ID=MMETSP0213-20121227/10408_1 /TAXON_ID=151035 /ORGANISM="Euplotes harpa, Strain FSP1.4" /LENGTH=203 /DNA_ID=CAMNT_0008339363 /DNA_START=1 /DNA_END=612 /DNA_ORIENTATION=+